MASHWGAVAAALAGARGLLGYEALNEPWSARPAHPEGSHNEPLAGPLSDNATLGMLYNTIHAAVGAPL